jgi:hypothetical protein
MAGKLNDLSVSLFLEDFRSRPLGEQQASPIWQELIQFPSWGNPIKMPDPRVGAAELPDPRMSAPDRAEFMKKHGPVTDDSKAKSPHPGSMTTAGNQPNPWSDYRQPEAKGFVFMGVKTELPPPWPGEWQRVADGWVRRA